MTSGSSPFIDNPSNNSSIHDVTTTINLFNIDQKSYISKLQYQISTFETERKLWKSEKDSIINQYETNIKSKNDELSNLKLNFDYVYNEKLQLEDKLSNLENTSDEKLKNIIEENKLLKSETNMSYSNINELRKKNDRLIRKTKQITTDYNYQIKLNDELQKEIQIKEGTIMDLQSANDNLVKQLKNGFDSGNQLNKINNLQNTNHKLQIKIDALLQNKTSIELLKQKNISLINKIQSLENLEEKYIKLEVEKLQLESKYNQLFQNLANSIENNDENEDVTASIKVENFIALFKESQIKNLTLQEKLNNKIHEYNELKQDLEDHIQEFETDYLPSMNELQEKLKIASEQNLKLERVRNLNIKEIEFLRNSLKNFELKKEEPKEENKSMNQYVTNLEKLVDEYKTKINELKNIQPETYSIGDKRPNIERHSFKSQAIELEKENTKLSNKIHQLESTITELNSKLATFEKVEKKEQILQFKNNLLHQDQMIKQETLTLLKQENESLINKYINNLNSEDLIPKAIFQRQEGDKNLLQIKIDQLIKKNNRLKDCYTAKSKDILTIISRYFGFLIEFLPNPLNNSELSSRLKLTSRYTANLNNSYLIIDIDNKSLKAYGNYEFKSICEELANDWVVNKGQFPCLLSALNLKIYESYCQDAK
ncbi:unnamed protein product [Candida verbasci]|uniref:Spindle assembly checkpoint component MAD1 n=1 Tax=Candida verbasci TaxID=1227364 RepID=A0A9W4TUF0_9ASCO|nr:unnamed protein product [Candida verbasci]